MPKIKCPIADCTWESEDLDGAWAAVVNQQLQMHDKNVHSQTSTQVPQVPQVKSKLKLDPPRINVGASPEEWDSFKRQWAMYKQGTLLDATQIATALFYCCSNDLRQDIMRDIRSNIANLPENDLLAEIKRLAVKEENILVHRMKLGKMTQTPGTGIRTFLANLRGQAALCQFTSKCNVEGCDHIFDFSNEIIKDNLIRGISDPEILSDLLGDTKSDRTLEEVVQFIAQKEQGKATRSVVGDSAGFMHHPHPPRSNIKTTTTDGAQAQNGSHKEQQSKCWACAGPSHGPRNDRTTRARKCPAWAATCGKCKIMGHYTKCCSRCSTCGVWGHRDGNSRFCKQQTPGNGRHQNRRADNSRNFNVEDDLTYTEYTDQLTVIHEEAPHQTVGHHIHQGKWINRPSKPHPVVMARLTPQPTEHARFGNKVPTAELRPTTIPMIADSGCQSSIIPLDTALSMGYKMEDIMPVTLSMRGAIREDLGVEGGIILDISVKDEDGNPVTCKQMIYLSRKMDKAFLCREALEQLRIISPDFPSIKSDHAANISSEPPSNLCSCPERGKEIPPLPTELPAGLGDTDDDVPALKEWLLNYYGGTTFNVCEHQPLPMMKCEPLKLHLNENAKPVAVHKPAVVPIHWREKVFADLERDVALGVIEKVGPNTPVTWCSRMVVTSKADGTPRRTVDLQPQNKQSVRQTHHVSTPFRLAEQIPQHTKKTITDAWNGYHSIPLCEEDRHITTFITPWGRYRYKVAPQGFIASGDGYTQRFDALITDFKNKVKCVDDTCMWAYSVREAFLQTCEWLDLCARNGITLNPKKFQFAQNTVEFAGLTVTPENIKPSQKFLDSIVKFPTPKDISGARAWFGLVNQGSYAFSMAKSMKPFRELLKPTTQFKWTEKLEKIFLDSKNTIINEMKDGVRLFEPSRPTCLATDWSNDGIGFILKQKYCHCKTLSPSCCKTGWYLCLVGSRFTSPAESRYAPVEGEALAVAYALHQTRYYILGCSQLIVATDHKPLIQILNDRALTDITNRRLLNLKEKTLPYNFTMVHISGAKNKGPDAVSRYPPPTPDSHEKDHNLADDISVKMEATTTLYVVSNMVSWDMVKEATEKDDTLKHLGLLITSGMPDLQNLRHDLRPYHRYANHLSIVDGVIMLNQRIIVPTSLRKQLLDTLHAAHQGVNAMCERAADSIFWPGITIDITRTRNECEYCHRIAKSNALEGPNEISPSEYPFHKISCDYFQYENSNYLVIVDRYSNWPIVFKENGKAESLVKRLREVFITFGIPEELTSDGGPQFTAEITREFLKSWQVHHRLTSVANPHANTRAEVAVKTVKRMLMANTSPSGSLNIDAFQRAMLIYRNSIDPETKASPALIVFGRPIRDPIPTPLGKYCPHMTWKETMVNREIALAKRHSREHEKWSEHTRELKPLQVGDHVYVQNLVGNNPLRWERTGIVIEIRPFKQYGVKLDGSGRITLRNRRHLRKFTPFYKPHAVGTPHKSLTLLEPPRQLSQKVTKENRERTGLQGPDATASSPQNKTTAQPVLIHNAGIARPQDSDHTITADKHIVPDEAAPPRHTDNHSDELEPQETQLPLDTEAHVTPAQLEVTPGESPVSSHSPQQKAPPQAKEYIPLALRRLLPHNKPGKLES